MIADIGAGTSVSRSPGGTGCLAMWQWTHSIGSEATMRRLAHVQNIPQQDSAERAFNKLARTFSAQVEALKRYRTGGEQRVTVEHVTVNEGGQAIVGNVAHRGGGNGDD